MSPSVGGPNDGVWIGRRTGQSSGTGQHCVAPYNRPMLPAKSFGEQAGSVNRPVAPPAIELPGGLRELGRSPSPPKSARNPYLAFSLPL